MAAREETGDGDETPLGPTLAAAQAVLEAEAQAIRAAASQLDERFEEALQLLVACRGRVVTSGMGKAGFVASKLSSVLASVGVPSVYLHPAEAAHGDLGRVVGGDVIIAVSNSGATVELLRLLPAFRRMEVPVIALTGEPRSPLGEAAAVCLSVGRLPEACPLGLVPTASIAALHAVGDALALGVMSARRFTQEAYGQLHPAGSLGRSVRRVAELMRTGDANPVVGEETPLAQVLVVMTRTPGRPGAAVVTDAEGTLQGLFTDGDLRRLLEEGDVELQRPVREVMTRRPRVARPDELALEALRRMREGRFDQLPVVDGQERPVGLLDVQDLLEETTP